MMCYLKVLSCREQRFRDISTNFSVDYNHHSYPYWTLKSTLFPISRIVNPYTWISVVKQKLETETSRCIRIMCNSAFVQSFGLFIKEVLYYVLKFWDISINKDLWVLLHKMVSTESMIESAQSE